MANPDVQLEPPVSGTASSVQTVSVGAGDVLYHPAGCWHQVECSEDSLSINISLFPLTWADLVTRALQHRLWRQPSWRAMASCDDAVKGLFDEATERAWNDLHRPEILLPRIITKPRRERMLADAGESVYIGTVPAPATNLDDLPQLRFHPCASWVRGADIGPERFEEVSSHFPFAENEPSVACSDDDCDHEHHHDGKQVEVEEAQNGEPDEEAGESGAKTHVQITEENCVLLHFHIGGDDLESVARVALFSHTADIPWLEQVCRVDGASAEQILSLRPERERRAARERWVSALWAANILVSV